jgi:hypothetical protein
VVRSGVARPVVGNVLLAQRSLSRLQSSKLLAPAFDYGEPAHAAGALSADWTWLTMIWWELPAVPPGRILWYRIELLAQWWKWAGGYSSTPNESSYYQHRELALSWMWTLFTCPVGVPEAPLMQDSNRYEWYASRAPGEHAYSAWFYCPWRGVTLTPQDKESKPNRLELLFATESPCIFEEEGNCLTLCFALGERDVIFDGKPGYPYAPFAPGIGPKDLWWSCAYIPYAPKPPPHFPGGDILQTASREPAGTPKPQRRTRTRRLARQRSRERRNRT